LVRSAAEVEPVNIADELKALENLHQNGTLTDEEFARAKHELLAWSNSSSEEQTAQQRAEARFQNELNQIDREWESDREKFYIKLRGQRRQLPTVGMALRTAALGCVAGLGWTVFTIAIGEPFGCFSVWVVIVAVFGVGYGIHIYFRAQEYAKALAAYQSRRNAIRIEEFQSTGKDKGTDITGCS